MYLAGPMVFLPDPDAMFDAMKAICARHGLQGVAPPDGQTALGSRPGHALSSAIVAADIALMHEMDAGVFCFDGFRRSPEMDPGTAFEIGYMHELGKPLAGWTQDVQDYPARVRAYFGGATVRRPGKEQSGDVQSGDERDPDGVMVHSEGCMQNAMTHIGIERSGGQVCADLDWTVAFERAIQSLRLSR